MSGWSSAVRILIGEGPAILDDDIRIPSDPHTQKEVGWTCNQPDPCLAGKGRCDRLSRMLRRTCRMALLTLTCATSASSAVSAQDPVQTLSQLYHTAWTTRDGAPADIFALAQTADGFLWLGSSTGLFRFDGVRFEPFEPPTDQALPSANVAALLALRDGGLWVGYRFGGASLIQRGAIRNYGEGDGLPGGTVWTLAEDSDGTIWVGTTGGLARLDHGRWHRVGPDEGFAGLNVNSLLVDRTRRLWVASSDGVFARGHGAARFDRVETSGVRSREPMPSRSFVSLQEAPDGAIWASSYDRGLRALAPSAEGRPAGASSPRLSRTEAILIDRGGALWVSRDRGIQRFWPHPPRGASMGAEQRLTQPQGLSSDIVNVWLQDREGNVWAGTSGGLDRFRRAKLARIELPSSTEAFAIAPADSGAIWVGSFGRNLVRVGDGIKEFPAVPAEIEAAYRDRDNVIWMGGPRGLWRSVGGEFKRVGLPEVKILGLQAITQDGSGHLWISIPRLGVYRMTDGRWVPFGDQPGLPREPAIVLTTDETGRTWFGYTANRVALLEGDTVRLYTEKNGLNIGNVLSIYVRGPHVWMGGELGLALLEGGSIRSVTGKNGLRFRGTSGIVETSDGEVWLHGAIGITRIRPIEVRRVVEDSTYQVQNERLDSRDGLDGAAAQIRPLPTMIAATDGRLWFATSINVAWLDPRAVPRNLLPPPVVIRQLTTSDKSYAITSNLVLPVHTTALRIDYTALSLSIPERVRFRYRLTGIDEDWQEVGGRREATYTNLRPGSYRFRVIAANEDGVWNEVGASFDFKIPPSFTQAPWFLAVWAAALGALVWLAYLARMRQVAGGLRVRYQAALAERTRIAHELHDTLLQGFTGITLQLRAIQRRFTERPQEGAEALKTVLESADTALRDARRMIWDMQAVELEGQDFAAALEVAARSATADTSAALGFTVRGDRRRLPVDVETTAFRIGREAVLNAVKHAAPRTVEVDLNYGPRALTLRVVDDGTGIPPGAMEAAARGEHFGIVGMRDRVRRAGGTLEISSELGRGTTVSVSLPIREPLATSGGHDG
jgi:signal transduction histidine kinase/ligand-binding sensor domain-containing protein